MPAFHGLKLDCLTISWISCIGCGWYSGFMGLCYLMLLFFSFVSALESPKNTMTAFLRPPLYLIVYLWQSSRNCTMWRHRSPQDNAVPFDNIFFPTRTIFKKKHLYSFLVKKGPLKQACIFYIYLNTLTRWVSSVQQMFHQNNLISWHSKEMITLHSFGIYLYPLIKKEMHNLSM